MRCYICGKEMAQCFMVMSYGRYGSIEFCDGCGKKVEYYATVLRIKARKGAEI